MMGRGAAADMSPAVHPDTAAPVGVRMPGPARLTSVARGARPGNGLRRSLPRGGGAMALARPVRSCSGMRLDSLFRLGPALLWLLLPLLIPGAVAAAPTLADLEADLRLTDAAIAAGVRAAGPRPAAAVAALLDGARERQAEARVARDLGRPGRARLATRVARRLAERALVALRATPDESGQFERQLRRGDRRLAAARRWMTERAARPRQWRRLEAAEGEMGAAWRAWRAGSADEALKRLSSVRQFFRELEARGFAEEARDPALGAEGGSGATPHLAATDRVVEACESAQAPTNPRAWNAVREAQATARGLAAAGRGRQAALATLEARRALVDALVAPGAPTREMVAALQAAAELVLDESAGDAAGGGGLPRLDEERLRGWRDDLDAARRLVADGRLSAAWERAASVTRGLADAAREAR